jgi:hypothetical protein
VEELSVIARHYDLALEEECFKHLADFLHRRSELEEGLIRKEQVKGLPCTLTCLRRFTVGCNSFAEERSVEMSFDSMTSPDGSGIPPFVKMKLLAPSPSTPGATTPESQGLTLELRWNAEWIRPGTKDFRDRWLTADTVLTLVGLPTVPPTIPYNLEGRLSAGSNPGKTFTLKSGTAEAHIVDHDFEFFAQAMQAKPSADRGSWALSALHFENPDQSLQREVVSRFCGKEFLALAETGNLTTLLQASQAGELGDSDAIWPLYVLPARLVIDDSTSMLVGEEPEIELADDDSDPDEFPGFELGAHSSFEPDQDDEPNLESMPSRKDWPSTREFTIRGLPGLLSGTSLHLHSHFFVSDEIEDGQHTSVPGLTINYQSPRSIEAGTSDELWNAVEAISAYMKQPITRADLKAMLQDNGNARTMTVDTGSVVLVLERLDPES